MGPLSLMLESVLQQWPVPMTHQAESATAAAFEGETLFLYGSQSDYVDEQADG